MPFDNAKRLTLAYPELTGQFPVIGCSTRIGGTNCLDRFGADFRGRIRSAVKRALHAGIEGATFGRFVQHVLLLRALPQMARIDAQRLIACMHDDVSRQDRLDKQFKRESMRIDRLARAENVKRAVCAVVLAGPQPTAVLRLLNVSQESRLDLLPDDYIEIIDQSHHHPRSVNEYSPITLYTLTERIAEHIRAHILTPAFANSQG